jgi:hypothetical protein
MTQRAGPGGPVDGPVDPAAPEQGAVGGVDDGVDRFPGDVADDHLAADAHVHLLLRPAAEGTMMTSL